MGNNFKTRFSKINFIEITFVVAESFLDKGGEFPDFSSFETMYFLGFGGFDEDFCLDWRDSHFKPSIPLR
jgi:hypothetical protein